MSQGRLAFAGLMGAREARTVCTYGLDPPLESTDWDFSRHFVSRKIQVASPELERQPGEVFGSKRLVPGF